MEHTYMIIAASFSNCLSICSFLLSGVKVFALFHLRFTSATGMLLNVTFLFAVRSCAEGAPPKSLAKNLNYGLSTS